MARRLALLLVLLATLVPAMAQTHYNAHVSVGAHGGVDLSRVSFMPAIKQRWLPGATMGVQLRYQEERLVGILAELNISQRGWSELYEKSPLRYERAITYVALPVMTHINFGSPRTRCFFNLGPEFSYMLGESTSANFDYRDPIHAEGWPNEIRMTEQMVTPVKNKFDYGICAGLGCEFYLHPRHSIYAECRFYYGLGNIFPASKADTFSASRCMTISATLGYNFRIK